MSAQPDHAPVPSYICAPAAGAQADLLAQLRVARRASQRVPAFEREWADRWRSRLSSAAQHRPDSSFLWSGRDLAAWGVATDPGFESVRRDGASWKNRAA